MEQIHFVWIGKLPRLQTGSGDWVNVTRDNPGPLFGPCSLLLLKPPDAPRYDPNVIQIFFWCLPRHKHAFVEFFAGTEVTVFSTQDLRLQVRETRPDLNALMDDYENLELILRTTGTNNIIKELTSSIIMTTRGGYFFDCSVQFSNDDFAPEDYVPTFPSYETFKIAHIPGRSGFYPTINYAAHTELDMTESIQPISLSYFAYLNMNYTRQVELAAQRLNEFVEIQHRFQAQLIANEEKFVGIMNGYEGLPSCLRFQEALRATAGGIILPNLMFEYTRPDFKFGNSFFPPQPYPERTICTVIFTGNIDLWAYYCPNNAAGKKFFEDAFCSLVNRIKSHLARYESAELHQHILNHRPIYGSAVDVGRDIIGSVLEALFFNINPSALPLYGFRYPTTRFSDGTEYMFNPDLNIIKFSGRRIFEGTPNWQVLRGKQKAPTVEDSEKSRNIRAYLDTIAQFRGRFVPIPTTPQHEHSIPFIRDVIQRAGWTR